MHPFLPSITNPKQCSHCKWNYISHTKHASCESCSHVGLCEIFGAPFDKRSMLLCNSCFTKEMKANEKLLEETKIVRESEQESMVIVKKEISELDNIQWNGDFFNNKIKAIEELRSEINNDDSIAPSDKAFKFQDKLMERFLHLKKHIFELDEEKYRDVTEQLVIKKTLNDIGNELRKEIREKIKESDSSYIAQPIVKTKVSATVKSKSPEDRVIEALALAKGITKDQARILMATLK